MYLSFSQKCIKRNFDIVFSILGLMLFGWLILLALLISSIECQKWSFFTQVRVGKNGKLFKIIKIRTMRDVTGISTVVTTEKDVRITKFGRFFRKTKIDELPQLLNVLLGDMSFVGPRADVPEYVNSLSLPEREIFLLVRPGITGPATLKYRDEEKHLATVSDPEEYNKKVIFPDKVKINKEYVLEYSFWKDLGYILLTVLPLNRFCLKRPRSRRKEKNDET